jgi:hypothetical protein
MYGLGLDIKCIPYYEYSREDKQRANFIHCMQLQ